MATRRTTMRSRSGKKLYAVRDKSGKFKDIQSYQKAHAADLRRTSKAEADAKATKSKVGTAARKTVKTVRASLTGAVAAVKRAAAGVAKRVSAAKRPAKKVAKKRAGTKAAAKRTA